MILFLTCLNDFLFIITIYKIDSSFFCYFLSLKNYFHVSLHYTGCFTHYTTQVVPHTAPLRVCRSLLHSGCATHCTTQDVPHTAPLKMCAHWTTQAVSNTVSLRLDCTTHWTTQAVSNTVSLRLDCVTHCTTQKFHN